jgi:microcystin-dependent protein
VTEDTNVSLDQLRRDLRKEVSQQAARWLVAAVVAGVGFAATGWWLYLKPKLVEIAGGVPSGVIAGFDGPDGCPAGWAVFTDAAGRTLVGVGKGRGLSERRYREEGGEEAHTLTLEEIPSHTHEVIQMVHKDEIDGVDSATTRSDEHHNESQRSGASGGGQAHNNMPPFLALTYCKKQ